MVSTRGHPRDFPEPDLSPSKHTTTSATPRARKSRWAHTPSKLTLLWLLVSLPLVIWDSVYVLLRPLTMPGGALYWPLYVPYELYGRTDYMYGWKAYHERNGFPSAQGALNVVETLLYAFYLYLALAYGESSPAAGRGAPKPARAGRLGQERSVDGKAGALAVMIAFSASIMTLSKTVLYGLNEYFSGFQHIGHNSILELFFLWVVPNGLWIVLPAYMAYVSGYEIFQGLTITASSTTTSSASSSLVKRE
ncbi:MAG: hypothetical protein M1818_004663 [Claussenomyces sp. TS43310]|nr:MAG: hypothetical protein M1818_004663 [Claussenomyces sp. TS43310]